MIQNGKIINICHISVVLLAFVNNLITDDISYNAFASLPFFKDLQYKIITMPELYIAMIILLSYIVFLCLYEYISKKKGEEEQENGDKTRKKIINILNIIVICVSVIYVLLSSFTLITTKSGDIPEVSDGKYLDVHDFGIADKITDTGFAHSSKEIPNKITVKKTVSSELTLTQEYYHIGDKNFIVYQDILEYRKEKTAIKVAEFLAADKYKNYTEYTAEGFEKVYVSSENLIAVINNTTYRITLITTVENILPSTEKILEIIKEKNS